jgi:hypothetical protein
MMGAGVGSRDCEGPININAPLETCRYFKGQRIVLLGY